MDDLNKMLSYIPFTKLLCHPDKQHKLCDVIYHSLKCAHLLVLKVMALKMVGFTAVNIPNVSPKIWLYCGERHVSLRIRLY